MRFDFPFFLVMATSLTGLIWLVDAKWSARERQARMDAARSKGQPIEPFKEPTLVELSRSFFPILFLVLVLRSFVIEPFKIPSGSMLPTLHVGDFIVVNKFAYGLRLPVLHTKILDLGSPERGDVVVFRHPVERVEFIKRVVGLPGDTLQYRNKQLTVNGTPVDYDQAGEFIEEGYAVNVLNERFGDASHTIMLNPYAPLAMEQEWMVPEGHYFVMGDNRDNSNDSRYWGMLADEHLAGKAFGIWFGINKDSDAWLDISWERIGMAIK